MSLISIVPALIRDCLSGCAGSSHYESHTEMVLSDVLSQNNCRSYVEQSRELRSVFAEAELSLLPPVRGHTHGVSAAARSSASAFIDALAPSVGQRAVYIQGSSADQRRGRVYTRHYRWGKDLNVDPRQVEKQENDLTAMIDVDYHMDMPNHLARNFKPIVLYTLQPSKAGSSTGEYKYCFDAEGNVKYFVSGGGQYEHRLWNWQGDSVSASRNWCFCIPVTYSVYAIERKQVDADHQIILVAPLAKYRGVYGWLAMMRAKTSRLRRLNPVDGSFVRILTNGPQGMTISTSKIGGYLSANIPVSVDEAIASAAVTTSKITHATVKAKMAQEQCETTGSEILLEYHLRGCPKVERVDVVDAVRSFQWVKNYQDYEPEKPSMVAFMSPIVDGAFVPDSCLNNDKRMVKERIEKLKKPSKAPTRFLIDVMTDFVNEFKRQCGTLEPVSNEEVYKRQGKPSQRRILDEAQHGVSNDKTSSFQKNEAYLNVNDPRAISIINGVDKMDYSAFIYALADALKNFEWYAFSKKPKDLAERVATICELAMSHVDLTDFSRMDGRVNELARYLERLLMLGLFRAIYHLTLMKLMKSQHGLRGKTKHGVAYNSGYARASGSPETSAFNTVLNAFIAYFAFRMTSKEGRWMTHGEAWDSLGVYGGDDGMTPDVDGKAAEKAAVMMGQKLTSERVCRGKPGVTFLARHYGPDVWFGDSNSCCDILRQSSKFHVTVRLSSKITPEIKLKEKAFAFSLTDSNTPVIGEFVTRVLELYPLKTRQFKNHLNIWAVELDNRYQYRNDKADWMEDLVMKQMPTFNLEGFRQWLKTATRETIFEIPCFGEQPSPNPKEGLVAVDGDFIETVEEKKPIINEQVVETIKTYVEEKERYNKKHYRTRKTNTWKGHNQQNGTAKQRVRNPSRNEK